MLGRMARSNEFLVNITGVNDTRIHAMHPIDTWTQAPRGPVRADE